MRHEPFAAIASVVVLVAGSVLLATRSDEATAELPSVPAAVEATPPPTAKPPARAPAPRFQTSAECPEMDNPGGLEWKPVADAGPFPTSGSVHLPSLDVAAPLVRVRVATDGTMVVPHNARDVAWLDQGPMPGGTNNIVLAGHISYSRVAGSFFRLRELAKGDRITVEIDRKHYKFEIVWNCYFDRNTPHAGQIMGKTNVVSVTLISCGGVFDRGAGTHSQRIAVRGELVG